MIKSVIFACTDCQKILHTSTTLITILQNVNYSCQYKFDNSKRFNLKFFEIHFNFILFHRTRVILIHKTHCQILIEKEKLRYSVYYSERE